MPDSGSWLEIPRVSWYWEAYTGAGVGKMDDIRKGGGRKGNHGSAVPTFKKRCKNASAGALPDVNAGLHGQGATEQQNYTRTALCEARLNP